MIPPRLVPPGIKQSFIRWIIVGYAMRIILMPLFAHEDLYTLNQAALILARQHSLHLVDNVVVIFILGAYDWVVSSLIPSSVIGLATSGLQSTPSSLLSVMALSGPDGQLFAFISKIPYLPFDFASGVIIMHLFDDPKKALLAFKLWVTNPVLLFVTYVMGQYDIIAVFFMVLALLLFKKERLGPASLSLGLAGAIKLFSILLVPVLAVISFKKGGPHRTSATLLVAAAGLSPLIISVIAQNAFPISYISANAAIPGATNGFFGTRWFGQAKFSNPLFGALVFFGLYYSASLQTFPQFIDRLYALPAIYALTILLVGYARGWTFESFWKLALVLLLAFYSLSLFLPQWFLWGQPFLILLAIQDWRTFWKIYLLSLPLFFVYIWYWGGPLTVGLLTPIYPNASLYPGPIDGLNAMGIDGVSIVNAFRSIMSGLFIFTILIVARDLVLVRASGKPD